MRNNGLIYYLDALVLETKILWIFFLCVYVCGDGNIYTSLHPSMEEIGKVLRTCNWICHSTRGEGLMEAASQFSYSIIKSLWLSLDSTAITFSVLLDAYVRFPFRRVNGSLIEEN